ncbi:MAG: hypothetical protein J6Y94_09160 [Bacteriovoracaceae bacterium]|nr:hypothetical protein [Bacteriovoracaceae bacterium]
MKLWNHLLILGLIFFAPLLFAKYEPWQAGDIILITTQGHTAQAIARAVPEFPYTHVGLLWPEDGQMMVLEVWQKVQKVSLADFMDHQPSVGPMAVFRVRELDQLARLHPRQFAQQMEKLYQQFARLEGKPYDDLYARHNTFYCSNFVQRLLNRILQQKIPSHPMQFKDAFWQGYFAKKGLSTPPQGIKGIAPGDFARSSLTKEIYCRLAPKENVAAIVKPSLAAPPQPCSKFFYPLPTFPSYPAPTLF